jgi:glutamate dehydrogenase
MMSNPDAKREHLARAAEAAAQVSVRETAGSGWGEPPEAFLAAYYRHVAAEDILTRNPSQLSGLAFSHRRLAMKRSTGSALVRLYTPTSEADGWPAARSLVQIVTDDMPFLVTSVTAELTRQGRAIHLVIHPQLQVRRDPTGHLLEVITDENSLSPDRIAESWISVVRVAPKGQNRWPAVFDRSWLMSELPSTTGQRCASRRCRRPSTCGLIRQQEWNRLMSRRR